MEWIVLLTSESSEINWLESGLTYGILALVIIVSLIVLSIVKRAIHKEASLKKVKAKGEKAKSYAEKLLEKVTKADLFVAATQLARLSSLVSEMEWNLACIVEDKKDVVLEGLATRLDGIATALSLKSEEAIYSEEEYADCIQSALEGVSSVLETVTAILAEKESE